MQSKLIRVFSSDVFFGCLSIIYVGILLHYSIFLWETRQRYGIIFLTLTMMIAAVMIFRRHAVSGRRRFFLFGSIISLFFLALASGLYFWIEYPSLVYERAGFINKIDMAVSALFICIVIGFTWKTTGATIPIVTLVFAAYGAFGHWIPGFLYHPPIYFDRFMEILCAEINGVFGVLTQIGATWIAIFAFFAGFVQGFKGLDYILRTIYKLIGRWKVNIPQTAVLSSMGFGCMSGSAGANAAGTGSFTIPTMKRFGIPSAHAASIEAVASSGGQIMPPILGAAAFVMCDYLGMYYYEILLASIFPSIIFFGSTMLSVFFIAKRYIDPSAEIDMPQEFKEKMSVSYLLQGIPIALSIMVLLIVFIFYQVNILIGGFCIIAAFLITRLVYEAFAAKGKIRFLLIFLKGVYNGAVKGTEIMVPIGAMLGTLGIVIRILTTTGLAEKISYYMVFFFGDQLLLLLFFTMVICILFGMAVTTVAAYILVVTLAAPALIKVGVSPLVAHFSVFYWAMLSGITPPVAGVCVITAGISGSNFLKTCWEAMKLGSPKFIMPFLFVAYPSILSFSAKGLQNFIVFGIAFCALSAGIQSGWGWWQQILLLFLGALPFLIPVSYIAWICAIVTIVVLPLLWRTYSSRVSPVKAIG
jgi:TRAP transporter 4TM/12TM fusion protein